MISFPEICPRALARSSRSTGTLNVSAHVKQTLRAGLSGGAVFLGTILVAASARAQTPLSYLEAHGARAYPINSLTWALIIVSLVVVLMSIVLVLAATFRRRMWRADALPGRVELEPLRSGIGWIAIGVGASTLVLFGMTAWTVVTLAAVSSPPGGAKVNLEIIGHQWWWEVRYLGDTPDRTFRTANDIHVPVGQPVGVTLRTADVIHSFWVPALNGKTDLIPGQTNTTWFSASRPGVYRGQCTEYCGQQHAHMGLEVMADTPDDFRTWWDHQLEPARAPESDDARQDREAFITKCGACHAVRGTRADGVLGPDLSHLMTRRSIAAATLPNTIGYLSGWIADPQHVKPGALMPRLDISGPELTRIRRFLETLK
jgi:cytochrome c oxidase subunit 2